MGSDGQKNLCLNGELNPGLSIKCKLPKKKQYAKNNCMKIINLVKNKKLIMTGNRINI